MRRIADRILVGVYVAIAAVPLVGVYTRFGDTTVFGSVARAPRPVLTTRGIVDETYQPAYTRWLEQNVGFRGYAIRADNTLLYHLFGETKPDAKVVLGRDRMLFERDDIEYYSKTDSQLPAQSAVDAFADQLAMLQQRLRTRGTSLVPVIIPSKTTVYRDHVPDVWMRPLGAMRPSDERIYLALRRALEARGVLHVDARAMMTRSDVDRRAIWARDARHWSAYAACQALVQVLAHHATLAGTPLIEYPCSVDHRGPVDRTHPDLDLWRLLNAWFVPRSAAVPVVAPPVEPAAGPRPDMLVVGCSFSWTLLHDAERSQVFGALHMNYYNNTIIESPTHVLIPIGDDTARWDAMTLDKDVIVLDLFESYLFAEPSYSRAFLDQLVGLTSVTSTGR